MGLTHQQAPAGFPPGPRVLHWYLRNQTIPGGPHRAPLVGSPSTKYRCADQHLLDRKPLCARAGDLRQLPPQPIAQFPRLLGGRRADAQADTDGGPPGAGHRANCSRVSKTVPARSGRGRPAPPASSPHPAPTPRGTCRRRRSPSAPAASPSARRPSSVHCPATCDCHARSATRDLPPGLVEQVTMFVATREVTGGAHSRPSSARCSLPCMAPP